jgi:hypothetical protein
MTGGLLLAGVAVWLRASVAVSATRGRPRGSIAPSVRLTHSAGHDPTLPAAGQNWYALYARADPVPCPNA